MPEQGRPCTSFVFLWPSARIPSASLTQVRQRLSGPLPQGGGEWFPSAKMLGAPVSRLGGLGRGCLPPVPSERSGLYPPGISPSSRLHPSRWRLFGDIPLRGDWERRRTSSLWGRVNNCTYRGPSSPSPLPWHPAVWYPEAAGGVFCFFVGPNGLCRHSDVSLFPWP